MGFADFVVRLALDSRKFTSNADAAKKSVKDMVAQIDSGNGVLGRFSSLISRFTGGAGVAGAAAGGFKLGRAAQNAAGDLADLADAMDTTVASAQRLKHAAGVTGVEFPMVQTGVEFVRKSQSEALQGNMGPIDNFARLGVTIDDLKNKSGEELFLQIASGIESGSINAANFSSLLAVMGKQASALVPAFKDGFASAANGLEKIGRVGTETVNDLDGLNKTWTGLIQNFKSGAAWLGMAAAGKVSSLAKFFIGSSYAASGDKETASDIFAEGELANDSDYGNSLDLSTKLEQRLARAKGVKSEQAKQTKEKADKEAEETKKLRAKNAQKLSEMRVNALPKSLQEITLMRQSEGLQAQLAGASPAEREKIKERLLEVEQKIAGISLSSRGALTVAARPSEGLTRLGLYNGPAESASARIATEQISIMRQQITAIDRVANRVERLEQRIMSSE